LSYKLSCHFEDSFYVFYKKKKKKKKKMGRHIWGWLRPPQRLGLAIGQPQRCNYP